jgi:DNA polymerase-3 subunit epsilon
MNIIAIDFETANEKRSSPCAIGLAWIDGGNIIRTEEYFIRPKVMRFLSKNIRIHGITPKDVEDECEFPDIWDEIKDYFTDSVVFAHNAAFDMSVLRATLSLYGIPWPTLSYLCTVKLAEKVWPFLVNHRLPTVSQHIGVALDHHRAGSDARACAAIAIQTGLAVGASNAADLAVKAGITLGQLREQSYVPCSSARKRIW